MTNPVNLVDPVGQEMKWFALTSDVCVFHLQTRPLRVLEMHDVLVF